MRLHPTRRRTSAQQGLSLVELMVGITVGLFVVAAAALMVSNQLSDNRRLLLETQLQQDLRATMDIVTRQLRRAGAQARNSGGQGLIASPAGTGGTASQYQTVTPAVAAGDTVTFAYYMDAGNQGEFGFRLLNGVVQTEVSQGNWQDLTDANTMLVRQLTFTPANVESVALPCPKECAGGGTACWPTVMMRTFVVEIVARARNGSVDGDPSIERRLRNEVRVRNDWVRFNIVGSPNICPA